METDRITDMKKKHNRELRESILNYKVVSNRNNANLDYTQLPDNVNIIIFGPSKSGKSSLIKTFYHALYTTNKLPNEYNANLIIQKLSNTEGTKKFTKFSLKQPKKVVLQTENTKIVKESSQINVYDTRGQVLMDEREIKQIELIMEGRAKSMTIVEQRTWRYAYLLWEFWKKDSDLFPNDVVVDSNLESRPHSLIFVFDGSTDKIPTNDDEIDFYRDVLQKARSRNYFYPQIVLTKVDKVEEKIKEMLKKSKADEYQQEEKLREIIDMKIEEVVRKLGVPRETVHFIENYHEKHTDTNVDIDYYALKLLDEGLKQGDNYLESILPNRSYCKMF